MELSNDFDFSLEPKSIRFTIGSQAYVLREASEEAYTSYRNLTMRHLRFVGTESGEKKAQLTGGAEADTQLLAKCMFKVSRHGDQTAEEPVPFETVSSLPRRITSRLLNWVRENSGMNEDLETAEFLEKRIKSDTEKLAELRAEGAAGKDGQPSTSNTST